VTTPIETIYEEMSVLEVLRLSVETVAVQMACIVIDNHHWRLFKPCAKDIEGVSWRLTTFENLKKIDSEVDQIWLLLHYDQIWS